MSIDPVDDCTFWYTNQYLKATGTFNWSTRIASFTAVRRGAGLLAVRQPLLPDDCPEFKRDLDRQLHTNQRFQRRNRVERDGAAGHVGVAASDLDLRWRVVHAHRVRG